MHDVFQPELVSAMYDFAQSFTQLHLNDTEVGLFTGVVLATTGKGLFIIYTRILSPTL